MGSGRIFPHPMVRLMAGDADTEGIGVIDAPVPQGRRLGRKSPKCRPRKTPTGRSIGPYRKPTQVCQASIRRRSGELS